ncbi:Exodeoxyribonuclease 1 [Cytospora mali]|uniref:Exodeoxyribonuclease 1 n=1 Tax=Cytospora mali TaxID=578113 RepID=A0A194V2T6_CYTMA|nr:Exodeoxyribonuclease 1 [Valsa mali var. pyri (nom. inval.)]
MGIQGLLPLLKSIQKHTEIKKFPGEIFGIDAYGWLHRGAVGCAIELAQGKPTRKYVDFAMHRVRMLKHFGVTPYLVFDGDFLPSKARTESSRAKRREESKKAGLELLKAGKPSQAQLELQKAIDVTPEMARHLIDELKKDGIPYVVAPYEADAQLVYLERMGFITGIISEDSDLLVFGAKRLLTKMDQHGQCVEINRRDFCAVREISLTGWTDDQFRQMAIFSGCDYLEGIGNIGLKTAYRMMRKYKTPERVIQMLQFDGKFRVSENYLAQYKQAELTFLHQRVFCPEKEDIVLLTEPHASTTLDIEEMPYIGARVDRDLAKAIAVGDVNPISKEPIVVTALPSKRKPSYATTSAVPAAAPGNGRLPSEKSIDSYFKGHRRIPMGEMDRNCFSVDPQRVAALTQNGLTPRVFPLPRPYVDEMSRPYSTMHRRRTEPISRTLSDLDPSINSSTSRRRTTGPINRRISDADMRPPKKARLCEDDSANENPNLPETSKFFTPEKSTTQPQKLDTILMSDDSIEEALASLPDIRGDWNVSRTSGAHQTLEVFQDESPKVRSTTSHDADTKNDEVIPDSPVRTQKTSIDVGAKPKKKSNGVSEHGAEKPLRGLLQEFSYTPVASKPSSNRTRMAFGLPTPASSTQGSETSETRPLPRSPADTPFQTPLQRIGSQALQRGKANHSPLIKARQESGASRRRRSLRDSLDTFPINPSFVPLPKVDLEEVEALNKPNGSEDQIIPDSDEENDPTIGLDEGSHPTSRRLDLSRFVYH